MSNTNNIIACICEGAAEDVIVNILLDADKLIFTREELLDNTVIRTRGAQHFERIYLNKDFGGRTITIYRILDSRKENFNLSKVYKRKVEVINIITSPEIEMLVIIKEGEYKNYLKYKNKMKPNEYCKNILKLPKVKSNKFISAYFSCTDDLVNVILEYKEVSNRPKGEKCLADLIK